MGGIIVLADMHLGISKNSISMPGYFADFMNHITSMNRNPVVVYDGTMREKFIENPEKIIFLGDTIELWDSQDEAVNFCMSSLICTLSDASVEGIYVLGNHDSILDKALLSRDEEYYCFGKSTLRFMEDVYPPEGVLSVGEEKYVFVHGHQFDKHFMSTGRFHRLFPMLRKLSNQLTLYVPFLFAASMVTLLINEVRNVSIFLGGSQIVTLLLFLTIPKLYMSCGRPLWYKLTGVRYEEKETIENFTQWWRTFSSQKNLPEDVNVVYGHTHFLNYLNLEEWKERGEENGFHSFYRTALEQRKIKENPALINVSAWVKDTKDKKEEEEYKNVMVASFLYIDEHGFEFFGWDWREKRIFHIPKSAIVDRRRKGCVDEKTIQTLRTLGWPEKLIEKWKIRFILKRFGWWDRLVEKWRTHSVREKKAGLTQ